MELAVVNAQGKETGKKSFIKQKHFWYRAK